MQGSRITNFKVDTLATVKNGQIACRIFCPIYSCDVLQVINQFVFPTIFHFGYERCVSPIILSVETHYEQQ